MTLLDRPGQGPSAWRGELPITSRYTAGVAGERFFQTLKEDGHIMGSVCPNCDRLYVPGVLFCERCLAELTQWENVGLIGEVHTLTQVYVGLDDQPLKEPVLVAFITFGDGGLIHLLGGADEESFHIGMLVEAVLKPKEERTGAITDIAYFKPFDEGWE